MSVQWRTTEAAQQKSTDFRDAIFSIERLRHPQYGAGQRVVAVRPTADDHPQMELEWILWHGWPLLQWRLQIHNRFDHPIALDRMIFLELGPAKRGNFVHWRPFSRRRRKHSLMRQQGKLRLASPPMDLAFYSTGWQSWNFAGVLSSEDVMPRSRLGMLTGPMLHNPSAPRLKSRGAFHSDMFGVIGDRLSRKALLAGFLSQSQIFGGLEVRLDSTDPYMCLWGHGDGVILAPGETFQSDWAALQWVDLDTETPLEPYLRSAAFENNARMHTNSPSGWCSWYYFYQSLTQEDVRANLAWAEEHTTSLPLELIQIDDGYQAEVGDWFERNQASFPDSLSVLSQQIHHAGFKPGLWLAPLIVKPGAALLKQHPDWILRNRTGRPVNAGFIWDTFTRALDVTHPEVIAFVSELIETAVKTWGFDYLKLDFLYAGALKGERYDKALTRAQALRRIINIMRDAAGPETTLVGCGCPLGAGIGIFDTMRVGPDVAPYWDPSYRGLDVLISSEPTLPSTRNALQGVLSRAFLHKRWWVNDGDCLLAREEKTRLSEAEFQTLATVLSLSGGALILSDHLPELSAERVKWITRLIPLLPREAKVLDWFDAPRPSQMLVRMDGPVGEWLLVALLNWEDRGRDLSLNLESLRLGSDLPCHMLDFWQARYDHIDSDQIVLNSVPAHGVRLFSLRSERVGPQWVGDTLHVSQGLAVRHWRVFQERLEAVLDLGHKIEGQIWLQLPKSPGKALLNGQPVGWQKVTGNIFRFDLVLNRESHLEVSWDQVSS